MNFWTDLVLKHLERLFKTFFHKTYSWLFVFFVYIIKNKIKNKYNEKNNKNEILTIHYNSEENEFGFLLRQLSDCYFYME